MRARWQTAFSVDLRSLALFRIGLALVLLLDIAARWSDFSYFYTEKGVLPLQVVVKQTLAGQLGFSLYFLSVYPWWPYILLAVTACSAIALAVGWQLRWICPLLWLLVLSLQNRAPLIVDPGDRLLSSFLFLGCFLPWDRVFAWGNSPKQTPPTYRVYHPALLMMLAPYLVILTFLGGGKGGAPQESGLFVMVAFLGLFVWLPGAAWGKRSGNDDVATPACGLGVKATLLAAAVLMLLAERTGLRLAATLTGFDLRGPLLAASAVADVGYLAVAEYQDGGQRHLDGPEAPTTVSYRQRLYRRSLERQDNPALKIWMAYELYRRESMRVADGSLERVVVYQDSSASGVFSRNVHGSKVLFAAWPP